MLRIRVRLLIVFVLLLSMMPVAAVQAQDGCTFRLVAGDQALVIASYLSVRNSSENNGPSNIVGQLENGDTVKVLTVTCNKNRWTMVSIEKTQAITWTTAYGATDTGIYYVAETDQTRFWLMPLTESGAIEYQEPVYQESDYQYYPPPSFPPLLCNYWRKCVPKNLCKPARCNRWNPCPKFNPCKPKQCYAPVIVCRPKCPKYPPCQFPYYPDIPYW